MLRQLGAVFAGLVVGSIANMAIIVASWTMWPMPAGLDPADAQALAAYVASLPTAAFVVVMLAHLAQAGIGGWVAASLGTGRPLLLALVVGTLSMVGGVINLATLPAPAWMWIEVPLYLVVSAAAGQLVARGRADV